MSEEIPGPVICSVCGAKIPVPEEGCSYCGHGRKAKPKPAAQAPATPPVDDASSAMLKTIENAASGAIDRLTSFVTGGTAAAAAPAAAAAATAAAPAPAPAPAAAAPAAPPPPAAPPAAAPAAPPPAPPVAAAPAPAAPPPTAAPAQRAVLKPPVPARNPAAPPPPAPKPVPPAVQAKVAAIKTEVQQGPAAQVFKRGSDALARQKERQEETETASEELEQLYALLGIVYYVALADEELDDDEWDELMTIFGDLTDGNADEDTLEAWMEEWDESWEEDDDYDDALAAFSEALGTDELRRTAFDLGVGIAALDGEISEDEYDTVLYIAEALGIPDREARKALRKATG